MTVAPVVMDDVQIAASLIRQMREWVRDPELGARLDHFLARTSGEPQPTGSPIVLPPALETEIRTWANEERTAWLSAGAMSGAWYAALRMVHDYVENQRAWDAMRWAGYLKDVLAELDATRALLVAR
jgi:hypothetical protein